MAQHLQNGARAGRSIHHQDSEQDLSLIHIYDDEFECIETSGGMWYEFEARKDRREYDLRVDTNGNIEAYED